MYIVFFALWVIFNGRLTLEIALFGIVLSALLYAFTCKFLDFSPKKDLAFFRKLPRVLSYAWLLIVEIFKANLHVMKVILNEKYEVEPCLVTFKTKVKKDVSKAVLADSITLTPGTITVAVTEDEYQVHCLDKEFSEGLADSEFEQRLLALEGEDKNA